MSNTNSTRKNFELFSTQNKLNSESKKQIDLVFIIFLYVFSIGITYFFFQTHAETMIYYDSYKYFATAISVAHGTAFDRSPFILFISLLYPLFKDPSKALVSIRIINLIFTAQLIIFFYIIARKFFDPILSLLGSLLVLFIPTVMVFSVTLHNDIFSIAMGFASLYFSIKPKKLLHVILATIFILATTLTRIDEGFVFVIPYFIGISYYLSSKIRLKIYYLFGISLCVFFIPVYFVIQSIGGGFYSNTLFEHNILKQVITFVNFDTIKTVLDAALSITGNKALHMDGDNNLNSVFLGFVSIGILFFIYKNYHTILNICRLKSIRLGETGVLAIYLGILVLVYLLTLTSFHLGFHIEGNNPSFKDNTIVIDNHIEQRYLMGLQIIIAYALMYCFSFLIKSHKQHRIAISVTDKSVQPIGEESLKNKKNLFTNSSMEYSKETENKFSIHVIRKYIVFFLFAVIIILLVNAMLNTIVKFYFFYAAELQPFYDAQPWISEHVNENARILLPNPYEIWALDPTLIDKTYVYRDLFHYSNGTKFALSSITTVEQKEIAHQNFQNLIHDHTSSVKYVAIDWNDSYSLAATGITVNDLTTIDLCKKIGDTSKEVKRSIFISPYSKWVSAFVVCQV